MKKAGIAAAAVALALAAPGAAQEAVHDAQGRHIGYIQDGVVTLGWWYDPCQ